MLTIKNRVMATVITTVALLTAAPALLLAPAADASTPVVQQPASKLIAGYYDDYGYSDRHSRYINRDRYRRHNNRRYQYNSYYQPKVIYNKPVGIYAPAPRVIYAPAPVFTHHQRRCVRTLYSTICN